MKNDRDFDIGTNLFTALNNLPETDHTHNLYVWTKCFLLKESNYTDLPTEIISENLKSAVDQIIELRGFDYNTPLKISDTITMHYLLPALHFKINMITDFIDGTMQLYARHMVEEEEDITLYFIQKSL